jgi:hypothetical protein
MEPTEIQARATIAAALILTRAVEIPTIPTSGDWSRDTTAMPLFGCAISATTSTR